AYKCNNENAKNNLIRLHIDMFFNERYGLNGYVKDKLNAEKHLEKAKNLDSEKVNEIALESLTSGIKETEKGIDKTNYKRIIAHIKRAKKLGADVEDKVLADVYFAVYYCYKKGEKGFKKDKKKARHYLHRAAEYGNEKAVKKLKRKF
ncbi:MAG: hypothetical protein ACI4QE_05185, partial [Acutalibacteraceae bacterium]